MMQPHTAAHSFSHSIGIGFFAARPRALLTIGRRSAACLAEPTTRLPHGASEAGHCKALPIISFASLLFFSFAFPLPREALAALPTQLGPHRGDATPPRAKRKHAITARAIDARFPQKTLRHTHHTRCDAPAQTKTSILD